MAEAPARQSYPYMSTKVFATIRGKLRQSRPSAITADWLASVLDVSEKAAKNTFPQLRAMKLVEADGAPSAIADDLRVDDSYQKGCQEIVEAVYPTALRDAFPSPDSDLTQVTNWFIRNANTGEKTAERQARLYLYLLKGEIGEPEARNLRASNGAPAKRASPAKRAQPMRQQVTGATSSRKPESDGGPNLHIDVQIHIAADAGEEQIEAIFASMAKHLYGR